MVYGFNDGLTANLGLVATVVGAQLDLDTIILTGMAGVVAGALSIGSSGYLATKSQREVHEHEVALEREEIRLMPDLEEQELALIYRARCLPEDQASRVAQQLIKSPRQALAVMEREELGVGFEAMSPIRESWITAVATAVGAVIPVIPFLFLPIRGAVWTSFLVAMGSHFLVGAARSIVTGRGVVRSGVDMFLIGLGISAVGYLVGDVLVRYLLG